MAICEGDGRIWGRKGKCVFWDATNPPIALSKEAICDFIKTKRDSCPEKDRPYYAAVYFVLRNRTEENWGPKELTMNEAMRMP